MEQEIRKTKFINRKFVEYELAFRPQLVFKMAVIAHPLLGSPKCFGGLQEIFWEKTQNICRYFKEEKSKNLKHLKHNLKQTNKQTKSETQVLRNPSNVWGIPLCHGPLSHATTYTAGG